MQTALVTGCSTGIGFATALRLAQDGLRVYAGMRNPDRDGPPLTSAAKDLPILPLTIDVTDDASVDRAFSEAGPVDVLVNNAGVSTTASVEEMSLADWRSIFETNVFGAVRCIRAALPGMRVRGSGCIVNVSSGAGQVFMPGNGCYSASKAALEAMSEALAAEVRPHGIRVVVIQPGATKSAMGDKIGRPSKSSPYWGTIRNTLFWLNGAFADASDPDVVAASISRAAIDPAAVRFRVPVARWSQDLIDLRRRLDDESWLDLMSAPTRDFVERYKVASGVDLTDPPVD